MDQARYYSFSNYLRRRFGCRVHKVTLHAGFTCPNRDGRAGSGGCIYCDNRAFSLNVRRGPAADLRLQLAEGIARQKKRFKSGRFIAYFQAYTNTYDTVERLRRTFDVIRDFPEIVGLSVGTRPDCIDAEKLELLESYAPQRFVWVEYGLQSAHDRTLRRINRGHTAGQFLDAVEMTRGRNMSICVHLILGLPGETREMMLETARFLARLPIHAVKLHNQCVVRGTRLEEMHQAGEYQPLSFEEYVRAACDFLELIPRGITVQRLTADVPRGILAAPGWAADGRIIRRAINDELTRRGSFQGMKA